MNDKVRYLLIAPLIGGILTLLINMVLANISYFYLDRLWSLSMFVTGFVIVFLSNMLLVVFKKKEE